MPSFCTRCGDEAGEGHGSNGEEDLDHGFRGVVTCGLTPAGVNLFKEFAMKEQMEEEGRRTPGAERVGRPTP